MAPSLASANIGPITQPPACSPTAYHTDKGDTLTHDYCGGGPGQTQTTAHQQKEQQQEPTAGLDPAKTWNPDARVYYSRRLKKPRSCTTDAPLPQNFPAQIEAATTPLVWSGQDLTEGEYLRHLSTQDIAEIEGALRYFKGVCTPVGV
jgi:hypothetical protein